MLSSTVPLQLDCKVVPAQAILTFHNWTLSIDRAGETQAGKTRNFLVFAGFVHTITAVAGQLSKTEMDSLQKVHFHGLAASRWDLVMALTAGLLKTNLWSMFWAGK